MAVSEFDAKEQELAYLAERLSDVHDELNEIWETLLDERQAEAATKPKPNPVNAAG